MKPTTIRIKRTVYGNYIGYIGREQVEEAMGMDEWQAKEWLCQTLDNSDYVLSESSYIGAAEVEVHRKATR